MTFATNAEKPCKHSNEKLESFTNAVMPMTNEQKEGMTETFEPTTDADLTKKRFNKTNIQPHQMLLASLNTSNVNNIKKGNSIISNDQNRDFGHSLGYGVEGSLVFSSGINGSENTNNEELTERGFGTFGYAKVSDLSKGGFSFSVVMIKPGGFFAHLTEFNMPGGIIMNWNVFKFGDDNWLNIVDLGLCFEMIFTKEFVLYPYLAPSFMVISIDTGEEDREGRTIYDRSWRSNFTPGIAAALYIGETALSLQYGYMSRLESPFYRIGIGFNINY